MLYKKVLLVNPSYRGSRVKSVFCAGLGYVAESLKSSGIDYRVLDMSLGYSPRALFALVDNYEPDLIGFSLMTYRYQESYGLITALKRRFPAIPIAAGGPHLSLFREEVLKDCPSLDFGVTLEGEETIVELCLGLAPESIKGLLFRKEKNIVYTGDRLFIANLDRLPFPKYEAFELNRSIDKKVNALPIITSRGCPFNCIYCPVKYSIGAEFRYRSPENILNELLYWYERGYRRFSFGDDNFTLIKDRVYQLCRLINEHKMVDLKLSCDNGIRADKVDKDLLTLMKEAGFYRIAFGVEAGNNKILKILNKHEDIETILTRIREASELGYEIDLFFLVGSPGETRQDLEDSFKIALTQPINVAYFYNIIPFPKTVLFDYIAKHGRLLRKPQEYLNAYPIYDVQPLFETSEMTVKQRKQALRRAFSIMRETMYRSWSKKLAKLGWVGKFLAYVYTRRFVQDVILRQKFLNRLLYRIAKKAVS